MPGQSSSTAGRRPVGLVHPGLGGTEPESVEAEGGDRAVLTVADNRLPLSGDITLLNRSAAQAPQPALQIAVTDRCLEPAGTASTATDAPAALALIAQDAVDLLLSAEIRRVRVCGAEACSLRFVDRSPARNRRWCSMSRCGNRTKVRLHHARARRSEHTPAD